VVAGGTPATIFLILIWQALRGEAVVSPDALTLTVLLIWAALSAGLVVWPFRTRITVGVNASPAT
jgi:hypothetical protein